MLGLEHAERLTQQERAPGAFGQRRTERRGRTFDYGWFTRHRRIWFEQDVEHDIELRLRIVARRRTPAARYARAQCVDFALRQLRGHSSRRPNIGRRIDRVGCRDLALRLAMVK